MSMDDEVMKAENRLPTQKHVTKMSRNC